MPMVVTANQLRTGAVVYLGSTGRWVETIDRATVAGNADEMRRLETLAASSVARCEVTAVYAFAVRVIGDRPEPLSVRERIRAAHAPTV